MSPQRPSAVSRALFLGLKVVVVAPAAAVREQLAPAELLVEVETRHVAGADALVSLLGAGV